MYSRSCSKTVAFAALLSHVHKHGEVSAMLSYKLAITAKQLRLVRFEIAQDPGCQALQALFACNSGMQTQSGCHATLLPNSGLHGLQLKQVVPSRCLYATLGSAKPPPTRATSPARARQPADRAAQPYRTPAGPAASQAGEGQQSHPCHTGCASKGR